MVEVIQTNTHCHTLERSFDYDDMDIHDTSTTHIESLSERLRPGSPGVAESAKKHLNDALRKKRGRLSFLPCISSARKTPSKRKSEPGSVAEPVDLNQTEEQPEVADYDPLNIDFGDERTNEPLKYTSDQFIWAVLYENQRGLVLFSTPYYSSHSLLPRLDPPAYTHPDTQQSTASSHPVSRNVTLRDYPLPDPTWRWVSDSWFVDMRGDGEVQHDGFEYNWCFRRHGWRSKVGWLGTGGFVRRRRWVRLMVRPSDRHLEAEATERQRDLEDKPMESLIPIYQPSESPLWRGDEYDWQRLRKVMRIIAMDGPKLELWRAWLTDIIMEQGPRKDKYPEASTNNTSVAAMNESFQLVDERPSQEWVLSVLKNHVEDLRHIFIFPESQSQFGELLLKAGLLQTLLPDVPDDTTRIATVLGANNL